MHPISAVSTGFQIIELIENPNSLITANPKFPELNNKNPAEDLWNKYGDERNNRVAVKVDYNGKPTTFNVSRTGYYEKIW